MRKANTTGIVVASIGGAAAVVGGLIPWYGSGDTTTKVRDIVALFDHVDGHGATKAWLGIGLWVVLALAAVAALFANVPGPMSTPLRVVGPLLGFGGALGTIVALNDAVGAGHSFVDHSEAGVWLVVVGLVAVGIAALLGPTRVRPVPYGYPVGPYGPQFRPGP